MKKIISTRGSGKTTQLIIEAAKEDATIICATDASVKYIKQRAKELNLHIREPISISKLKNYQFREDGKIDRFLVDELRLCMNNLIHGELIGYSLTIED